MKEAFLHYCWKYKRFNASAFKTIHGEAISIIDFGFHNHDSGPDFSNAKVKIGSQLWAGHIEIHVNSSDWYKHNHQVDENYDNVILHVVYNHDKEVTNTKGGEIPVLCIGDYLADDLYNKYLTFVKPDIPCQSFMPEIDVLTAIQFKDELFFERLARKDEGITIRLAHTHHNWEQCFYESLAKSLGMKTNGEAFEMLASQTPLNTLIKANDVKVIESILFGNSGLLPFSDNKYVVGLNEEYNFQKAKHSFIPMSINNWKFSKLRPANFPTIRIAQLAKLIIESKGNGLFNQLVKDKPSLKKIRELLAVTVVDGFWYNHFTFNKESKGQVKSIGEGLIKSIIINTIVPFCYAYGKAKADESYKVYIQELLAQLKPEDNKITRLFSDLGLDNAIDSQAVIEAYTNYCEVKRCLSCTIGTKILNKKQGS